MIPLAIGTAQFGQKYGICNKDGAVEGNAAHEIVASALMSGIIFFDTARLYGDSESVLGTVFPSGVDLRVITKLHADPASPERICLDFTDSLRRLNRDQVYAVLIHNASGLLGPQGAKIWDELKTLKDKKLVQKIGVSVYAPEEFIELSGIFELDVVQVPCSLLDQRFLRNDIQDRKKSSGIEFHARSLFLQGILANLPESIPSFMKDRINVFEKILVAAADVDMTMLDFCLSFASFCHSQKLIDRWVIGVDSAAQLAEIVRHADNIKFSDIDWASLGTDASDIIDPREWKRMAI